MQYILCIALNLALLVQGSQLREADPAHVIFFVLLALVRYELGPMLAGRDE